MKLIYFLIKHWREIKTPPKMLKQFGFILAGLLFVFGVLSYFRGHEQYKWEWPLSISALLITFFLPKVLEWIFRTWMLLAEGISWVVMRVILGFVFFGILTPIALIMRFTGKDVLEENFDSNVSSYWVKRQSPAGREQYEKLY